MSTSSSTTYDASEFSPEVNPDLNKSEEKKKKGIWGTLIVLGIFIFSKLKVILLFLPKVKFLSTSLSALVSIAAYALIWGWKFAIGFVALLFVHEMGHVLQLKREGIKASLPMFIPFLGAVVAMKEMPKNALAEARVGLAGPILGGIACLVPVMIYLLSSNELFLALAYVGFFLNLFNLLPVLPLDGGRAMSALSPKIWFVGFAALIALTVAFPNPIMILILIFGGFETYHRYKNKGDEKYNRYHEVSKKNRLIVALVYISLALFLGVGMEMTYIEKSLSGF